MKRRSEPDSSHMLARMPGYFDSRLSITSWTVAASTSTESAPAVNFRSGVGMTTLSDMILTPKRSFECRQFRFDDFRRRQVKGVERLQAVSCDREDGHVRFPDAALLDQFLR